MNNFDPAQLTILFDLDGTLVDTAPDIVAAANLMLSELNAPPLSFELVSSFIGNGVPNLVRCVLNVSEVTEKMNVTDVSYAEDIFFKYYRQTNGYIGAVFPGVVAGLTILKKAGCRLACVTNKPFEMAQILLQITGLAGYFEAVVGGDSLAQMKPAAEPLLHACRLLGGCAENALMVGDSAVDVAAARAAGMPVLIVNYGYPGSKGLAALSCDAFIDSFIEIPDFLAPKLESLPISQMQN
ncbi:MAG: phosphoglycolate phosphatase [Undibacterium sp.]|uniref:phosphoglycolate phosphatase n=1 Tax=Undibacterium sp. TaxID=1914977 RepID=UPI00271E2BB7|nr:phosphoglycolate phosphatase [Undibacterium sp.]MDO8650638.1 phosphoglycolate phosphatase [Undibacterium sp.]